MREAIFVTELRKGLEKLGAWSYKIPDAPYSKTMGMMRFAPEKPFDIACVYKGQFIAIECKQIKSWKSFGIKELSRSQLRNLFLVERAGGTSLVALNVRVPKEKPLYTFFRFEDLQKGVRIMSKDLKKLTFFYYVKGEIVLHPFFSQEQIAHPVQK